MQPGCLASRCQPVGPHGCFNRRRVHAAKQLGDKLELPFSRHVRPDTAGNFDLLEQIRLQRHVAQPGRIEPHEFAAQVEQHPGVPFALALAGGLVGGPGALPVHQSFGLVR